jgi:hypothetical protein
MTERRREAGPFRFVATGVTEARLDTFVALALRAWAFVPAQIGTTLQLNHARAGHSRSTNCEPKGLSGRRSPA